MFTETELREALQHSAARVRDVDDAMPTPPVRHRRRLLLPLAAAASVAALAVGAVALSRGTSTAPRPSAGTKPPVSSTPSPVTSHLPMVHVPADISAVVDDGRIAVSGAAEYDLANGGPASKGAEEISVDLDPRTTIIVHVIRPSSGFDPARIGRDHPVSVAGTTGYFSRFQLFPLRGGADGQGAGKFSPIWNVAYPAGGGTWVVVEVDHAPGPNSAYQSVDDPTRIVREYHHVGVTIGDAGTRLPFRTGYLPAGMRVDSLNVRQAQVDPRLQGPHPGGDKLTQVITTLYRGDRWIQLDVGRSTLKAPGISCIGSCPPSVSRTDGAWRATVTGSGYDRSTLQKVLDTLALGGTRTTWSVPDALG